MEAYYACEIMVCVVSTTNIIYSCMHFEHFLNVDVVHRCDYMLSSNTWSVNFSSDFHSNIT